MKTCDEWQVDLVELVYGELDDATEMELHQHLLACPTCRIEEKRLLGLREQVHGIQAAPRDELRARIEASLPRPRVAPPVLGLNRPVPAYVALATGLIGALLVATLSSPHAPRSEDTREVSRPAGIAIDAGPVLFTVAGSYATRVRAAGPEQGARDLSPARPRMREDSL